MLGAIQQRRAQLVQTGEGQLHRRLHAGRAGHPAPRRAPGQVLQQDGLAHARLPADYQGPALTAPHAVHEPVQDPALGVPVGQLGARSGRGEGSYGLPAGSVGLRINGNGRGVEPLTVPFTRSTASYRATARTR